jgi:O-antigen biosynthesis protein
MSEPIMHLHIHPLRRIIRRMPGIRSVLLNLLRPIMPQIGRIFYWLEGADYPKWFAQWQSSEAAQDSAIRALLGTETPHFVITLNRPLPATQASLEGQVAVSWTIVDKLTEDAATGRYILHLKGGDQLVRHALAEFALAAQSEPQPLIIFADEDRQGRSARRHAPWLKTSFDYDLLLQQAAFGHAVAYNGSFLARHGLLNLRGHRLMLAAARAAVAEGGEAAIRHIPAILLHRAQGRTPAWREQTDRTAIAAALAEAGEKIELLPAKSSRARLAAVPRLRWPLPPKLPQVSVIIPTRNGTALMEACLAGLFHRTDYPALEILVCDNGSDDPALLARFKEWSRDARFRVLPCPGPFNYSAINNQAAREASGEILLLLNNDTEVRHADWLREMVSHAIRPQIGAVGARLLYPSGRVQHSGTVLGLGGVAGHDMLQSSARSPGPYDLLRLTRRVSAVTAACLAVRREAFIGVGGFDEVGLRVAYNDVDLCLKLRSAGLHNLITPHAELLHKESATRGDDMSAAHRARWEMERATMLERWGDALKADPYYIPLLSLDSPSRILASEIRRMPPWRQPTAHSQRTSPAP